MAKVMKFIVLLLLVTSVAGAAFVAGDAYNRAGFVGSEGYIEAGSKFGIRIGMDREAAVEKLRSDGLKLLEPSELGHCLGRRFPVNTQVELWWDDSLFGGTICLASRDNVIVGVGWSFGGWEL